MLYQHIVIVQTVHFYEIFVKCINVSGLCCSLGEDEFETVYTPLVEDLIKVFHVSLNLWIANGAALFEIHRPSVHCGVTRGCSSLRPMDKGSKVKKGRIANNFKCQVPL